MAENPNNYRELCPGWFVDLYLGHKSIERMIRAAAEVAGVRFGNDLVINLGK